MKNISKNGFTLIELMIVVAIIGILVGIAYPSYRDSVLKSRRADAEGALLGFANAMERYFTEKNSYLGAAAGGTNTGLPTIYSQKSPVDGSETYYKLTIDAATANTYSLRATPQGAQADDSCGNLKITHTGVKSPATAGCW